MQLTLLRRVASALLEESQALGNRPDEKTLLESGLFDATFYNAQGGGRRGRSEGAAAHDYLQSGANRGLDPNPFFKTSFYQEGNPDVVRAGINPLLHYLNSGALEDRNPHPLFDTSFYRRSNPDVSRLGVNPLWHYLEIGAALGRSPCPLFEPTYYLKQCLDLPVPWPNPVLHFLKQGGFQGRNPSPFFDCNFYLEQYPDVLAAGMNPLAHFLQLGAKEGRYPHPERFQPHIRALLREQLGEQAAELAALERVSFALGGARALTLPLKVESAEGYLRRKNALRHYLPATELRLEAPAVYGTAKGPPAALGSLPAQYLGMLEDVRLVGGTRIVLPEDGLLIHDEASEFQSPDYGVKAAHCLTQEGNAALLRITPGTNRAIQEGILISSDHDNNYYHWLVECLPKVVFADTFEELKNLPLLISEKLHPNLLVALERVNRTQRPLIRLSEGQTYAVGRLWMPSDLSRILDRYTGEPNAQTDCVLSPTWVRRTVELLSEGVENPGRPWRKIYLTRRGGSYRMMKNEQALELELIRRGFEVTDLTGASMESQMTLLRQASVVVGPTGAALTNLLFCQPGSSAVVLTSNHESMNFGLFGQLAHMTGVDFQVVTGPRLYTMQNFSMHDDYTVEVAAVLAGLGRIERRAHAC